MPTVRALAAPVVGVVAAPADEHAAAISIRVAAPASESSLLLGRMCVSWIPPRPRGGLMLVRASRGPGLPFRQASRPAILGGIGGRTTRSRVTWRNHSARPTE